jgi:uncharacterized repeat protein (TIGR04138 family)
MQEVDFDHEVEKILAKDSRYSREAYSFVREALDFTRKLVNRENPGPARQHVSGQELLDGIRQLGLQQFGPMAATVLAEWGVTRCSDFGEIVYNMIDVGLFAKTDKDSREHFENGYDFDTAFRKPYMPQSKLETEKKPIARLE